MRVLCSFVLCWSAAAPAVVGAEGKKPTSTAEKIVGVWEATKGDLDAGSTVEFTKGGQMKIKVKEAGMVYKLEGTYKVAGDKLTITKEGGSMTGKIKKLTDKELVIEDDKGKATGFKRVK